MSANYAHQEEARDRFMAGGRRLYLNHGMASGKTRTAILIAQALDAQVVVVVCPIAVGTTWARHFAELEPGRRVLNLCGASGTCAKKAQQVRDHVGTKTAIVINYDAAWRHPLGEALSRLANVSLLILDEAHRAKAPGGKAARFLALLAKRHPEAGRLCLSGTPCPHSPLDLYAQYRVLEPEIFGTNYAAFRSRYSVANPRFPSAVLRYVNQEELAAKAGAIQHVVKTDDVLDLPPAIHTRIDVPLSPAELKYCQQMEKALVADFGDGVVTAANALVQTLRLRGGCSGHAPDGTGSRPLNANGITSKGAALSDWMADVPAREPVVVFGEFREDLRQARLALERAGREVYELSGQRRELELWQEAASAQQSRHGGAPGGDTDAGASAGAPCIVVQTQSGGAGVDLSIASYVVYMSMGYSLGNFDQSLARIRRPGQKSDSCKYFHLVAQGCDMDQAVYEALSNRQDVIEKILELISNKVLEVA